MDSWKSKFCFFVSNENLKFENHNFKNSICDDGNYHQYTVIQDVEKTVVKCDGLLIYQNFGTTSLNNKNNDIVLGAHYDSSTFHSRMQGSLEIFKFMKVLMLIRVEVQFMSKMAR